MVPLLVRLPKGNVVRKNLKRGDVIILLGRQNRSWWCRWCDGLFTKVQTVESETAGAEFKKEMPSKNKIQRLFRNGNVLVWSKCDFGAGGVWRNGYRWIGRRCQSTSTVPLKYQERMVQNLPSLNPQNGWRSWFVSNT